MTTRPKPNGDPLPPAAFPQRVLMVTGYLWGGGAEWHLLNLAWTLRRMGVQVDVAYVLDGVTGAEARWRRHGIELIRLRRPWELTGLIGKGYDLVHAHLFKGELAAAVVARMLRVPLVITRHSLDWTNLPAWQRATLRAFVQRRASGVIAISEAVAGVSREALGGRNVPVQVIRHGIAPQLLQDRLVGTDIRKELGLEGCKLVGTAARLSSDKGLAYLLQAFKQAGSTLAAWHIVIAGDGPERLRLEELAGKLEIGDRVHWLGWREDALDIVRSLDIFALPSIREGFGLALLEAMTFGTAAVVSNLPSIRETAEEAAVYVTPAYPNALAEGLKQLAAQPLLRSELSVRSRQQAEKFSAEAMARQTLEFYRTIGGQDLCSGSSASARP